MKHLIISVLACALGASLPLRAKLAEVSIEYFESKAPCALLIETIAVRHFDFKSAPETQGLHLMNRIASVEVLETVRSRDSSCSAIKEPIEFLFATEFHSSHPKPGEKAILFLVRESGFNVEAVYGRSYWRLRDIDGVPNVVVSWRNRFLVVPLHISSGETALVPLSVIRRRWSQ